MYRENNYRNDVPDKIFNPNSELKPNSTFNTYYTKGMKHIDVFMLRSKWVLSDFFIDTVSYQDYSVSRT
jgi:hypothetical protein